MKKQSNKNWFQLNPEKHKAYRIANRDKINAQQKISRDKRVQKLKQEQIKNGTYKPKRISLNSYLEDNKNRGLTIELLTKEYNDILIVKRKTREDLWKEKNKEHIIKQRKEYRKNNPEKFLYCYKSKEQKERMIVNARKWRKNNPEKSKACSRKSNAIQKLKPGYKEKAKRWNKIYREKNKEKYKVYQKQYHIDNREAINARVRKYYSENTEQRKQYARDYYKRYMERDGSRRRAYNVQYRITHADLCKAYRENNKEHLKEISKIWREKNKDRLKKEKKAYHDFHCKNLTDIYVSKRIKEKFGYDIEIPIGLMEVERERLKILKLINN